MSDLPETAGGPPPRLVPIQTAPASCKPASAQSCHAQILSPPITPLRRPPVQMIAPRIELPPTPRASLEGRPDLPMAFKSTKTREFKGNYKLGRRTGSGAWSDVYVAEDPAISSQVRRAGPTPPPSPGAIRQPQLKSLAIKKPSHRAARRVLSREARVLSFLSADPSSVSRIVPFHGIDLKSDSLVLDYAPLTLKRCSERALTSAQQAQSCSNMYDPIIGEAEWKQYAKSLISGLAWLHSKGVAHGDIKSDNILLHTATGDNPRAVDVGVPAGRSPVYCDFSSARLVDDLDDMTAADADDAMTTAYASPELLASLKSGATVDRQKADVWALAISLIVAATGHEPYSEARSSMMKLHLAKHGDVLGSVRTHSTQATRIMKGGYVAKSVAMALALDPSARVNAQEWLERLDF